jgi:hypothetical protein
MALVLPARLSSCQVLLSQARNCDFHNFRGYLLSPPSGSSASTVIKWCPKVASQRTIHVWSGVCWCSEPLCHSPPKVGDSLQSASLCTLLNHLGAKDVLLKLSCGCTSDYCRSMQPFNSLLETIVGSEQNVQQLATHLHTHSSKSCEQKVQYLALATFKQSVVRLHLLLKLSSCGFVYFPHHNTLRMFT